MSSVFTKKNIFHNDNYLHFKKITYEKFKVLCFQKALFWVIY